MIVIYSNFNSFIPTYVDPSPLQVIFCCEGTYCRIPNQIIRVPVPEYQYGGCLRRNCSLNCQSSINYGILCDTIILCSVILSLYGINVFIPSYLINYRRTSSTLLVEKNSLKRVCCKYWSVSFLIRTYKNSHIMRVLFLSNQIIENIPEKYTS